MFPSVNWRTLPKNFCDRSKLLRKRLPVWARDMWPRLTQFPALAAWYAASASVVGAVSVSRLPNTLQRWRFLNTLVTVLLCEVRRLVGCVPHLGLTREFRDVWPVPRPGRGWYCRPSSEQRGHTAQTRANVGKRRMATRRQPLECAREAGCRQCAKVALLLKKRASQNVDWPPAVSGPTSRPWRELGKPRLSIDKACVPWQRHGLWFSGKGKWGRMLKCTAKRPWSGSGHTADGRDRMKASCGL
jgi:hypothetical protein